MGNQQPRDNYRNLEDPFNEDTSFHALDIADDSDYQVDIYDQKYDSKYDYKHSHRRDSILNRYVGENEVGWEYALPLDAFLHAFSFLSVRDLSRCARVNRSWLIAAYEPSLWHILDLSNIFTRVNDRMVTKLLSSRRFLELKILSLEGCSAITTASLKVIRARCPRLEQLLLTDCHQLDPSYLLKLVSHLRHLKRLELFGVTVDLPYADDIKTIHPSINLGLFWVLYCASMGVEEDGKTVPSCRHEGGFHQRGCWGDIKGRIVYSNAFYHRPGNYPSEILYSCSNHATEDEGEDGLLRCGVCDLYFRAESMREFVCKVCFDMENLQNKGAWIKLSRDTVGQFNFSDICTRTFRFADRKNIPSTLKSYGSVSCRFDYSRVNGRRRRRRRRQVGDEDNDDDEDNFDDGFNSGLDDESDDLGGLGAISSDEEGAWINNNEDGDEDEKKRLIPLNAVPLSVFLRRNRHRLDDQVSQIQTQLHRAVKARDTRALLCYDEDDNVEVLADKAVIVDGRDGAEKLQLTIQAWHQALGIIWPILAVMMATLYFTNVFRKQTAAIREYTSQTTDYSALLSSGKQEETLSPELALILGGSLLLLLVIVIFLIYRYRDLCERIFKRFLVLDILMIFLFGGGSLILIAAEEMNLPIDSASFFIFLWNFSFIGLWTLYKPVPNMLHRVFLVILNAIMAIMMIATLGSWIIIGFISAVALCDLISELRPRLRFLSPFILPSNVELLYDTPRILYQVGGLRLRAADLMWYGLMMGIVSSDVVSILTNFVAVAACLTIVVFVAPFLGTWFRPLPVAFISMIVLAIFLNNLIKPYLYNITLLHTSPVSFPDV